MPDFDDSKRVIPGWDGVPTTWQAYVDDVRIWLLGERLDVPYSIAARLVARLAGAAKRVGNSMTAVELMPDPPPPPAQAIPPTAPSDAQRRAASAMGAPAPAAAAAGTSVPAAEHDSDLEEAARAAAPFSASSAPWETVYAQAPAESYEQWRSRLTAGVDRLLARLKSLLPSAPMQKGLTMTEFTRSTKYWRRAGERVTDWVPRWDEGVHLLANAGVDLQTIPDLLGHYFYVMINVGPEHRERLLASLPGEHFDLKILKEKAIQYFPDIHTTETRRSLDQQQQFTPGPSTFGPNRFPRDNRGRWKPYRCFRPRTTFETGLDEPWADVVDSDAGDEVEPVESPSEGSEELDQADFQNVLRAELEAFATELDCNAADLFDPDELAQAEAAAASLADASEALAILRDARGRIRGKGKGKGKGKGRFRPRSSGSGQFSASGMSSNPQPRSDDVPATDVRPRRKQTPGFQQSLQQRKAKSICRACGQLGHWAGDSACKQPHHDACLIEYLGPCYDSDSDSVGPPPLVSDSDSDSVGPPPLVSDSDSDSVGPPPLVSDSDSDSSSASTDRPLGPHQCAYDCDAVSPELYHSVQACGGLDAPSADFGRGAIDTASTISVAGRRWWEAYQRSLQLFDLSSLVTVSRCRERFRFGNGGILVAKERVTVPAVVCGGPMLLSFCVVDSFLLPLLIGRDVLENIGALINFKTRRLELPGVTPSARLLDSRGGHFAIDLRPGAYAQLAQLADSTDTTILPQRLQPSDVFCDEPVDGDADGDKPFCPEICGNCLVPGKVQPCSSCLRRVCYRCMVRQMCPGCVFDGQLPDAPSMNSAEAVQVQEVRDLKPGQQLQVSAGRRKAKLLFQHGLRNQAIRNTLFAQASKDILFSLSAAVAADRSLTLVEWCCEPRTLLRDVMQKLGVQVVHFGIPDHDLSCPDVVEDVIRQIRQTVQQGSNVFIWATLPSSQSMTTIQLLLHVLMQTLGPHVQAVLELPRGATEWRLSEVREMIKLLPHRGDVDGCCFNLRDRHQRLLARQWRIQTSSASVASSLRRRCSGRHFHGECKDAVASCLSVPQLAQFIASVICHSNEQAHSVFQTEDDDVEMDDEADVPLSEPELPVPDESEEDVPPPLPAAAEVPSVPAVAVAPQQQVENQVIRAAIQQLRRNMGHPSARALARAIRVTGGSDEAIKAALKFTCSSCQRIAEPKPDLPAQLRHRWRKFGDAVAVDLLMLADWNKQPRTFLNILDMASRYQVVVPVASKEPKVVFSAFLRAWLIPLGIPQLVLSDRGGEFNREFSEQLELMGSRVVTTAALSPTQNAPCERAGGFFKLHGRAVIDELTLSFDDDVQVEWLCACLNWARNSRVNETGFSPSQWVLGAGIRLPHNLWSDHLTLHSRLQEDPTFQHRLAIQAAAERSLAGLRFSRAISKAFLARARTQTEPAETNFQVGDSVFYWRGIGRRHAKHSAWAFRWLGPAIVIGREANNLWLARRGTTVKCAARHLRHALPEEQVPWDSLLEQAGDKQFLDLSIAGGQQARARNQEEESGPSVPPEPAPSEPELVPPVSLEPAHPPPPFDRHDQEEEFEPPEAQGPTAREFLREFKSSLGPSARCGACQGGRGMRRTIACRERQATFRAGRFLPSQPETPAAPPAEVPLPEAPLPGEDLEEMPSQGYGPVRSRRGGSFQQGGSTGSASPYVPPLRRISGKQPQPAESAPLPFPDAPLIASEEPEQADFSPEPRTGPHLQGSERPLKIHRSQLVEHMLDDDCEGEPHLVLLTGPARAHELVFSDLTPKEQDEMRSGMASEWSKWTEFKAARPCSIGQLRKYREANPAVPIIGTRWVLTRKPTGKLKARLVVQGCQETQHGTTWRRDAPTASPLAFHLVLVVASQTGWTLSFHDATAAFLQSTGVERLLLLRMPVEQPPPGILPGEVRVAAGSIYRTTDAPRAWYLQLRTRLLQNGLHECALEKGLFALHDDSGLRMLLSSHVDDLAIAMQDKPDLHAVVATLCKELHMRTETLPATYCGKFVEVLPTCIRVTQPKAMSRLEPVQLSSERKSMADSSITTEEQTMYRSLVGQCCGWRHRLVQIWLSQQAVPRKGL
ncbi:unnamed protein product [Polarella glacialis]|uniref:Integrase catalytic domain-containing protein n=1 Tax=Polarella glacialis TaxID=89957 RepID=A0A813DHS1_POLGL|nr:unnamed protein product [Polarella glacialis]